MTQASGGLGVHMRGIARQLTNEPRQLGHLIASLNLSRGGAGARVELGQKIMDRLVRRKIAVEVDAAGGLYARGPVWARSASRYGWRG